MGSNRTSRRQFLKRAAGASAGAFAFPYFVRSSALGMADQKGANSRIVVGAIGLGGQGTSIMNALMKMPDTQVVAVCDVDQGIIATEGRKARQGREIARKVVEDYYAAQNNLPAYKGCDAYGDFREMLARKDIDVVTICTPDHWHGLISIAAAKAGKDIYCEKPLVNVISEGRAVCDAVKKYRRVLQTGSQERSNPKIRFACELVRNGRLGKIHTVRINLPMSDGHHKQVVTWTESQPEMPVPEGFDYDFWLGPNPHAYYTAKRCHFWWRFILATGGGEMTDRGAHIIDLAQLGLGMDDTGPVEFVARGERNKSGLFDTFMKYDFQCTYANGIKMIGSNDTPRGLRFEGDKGSIFIHIHGGELEATPASLLEEKIGADEIQLGRTDDHRRQFIECVKNRGTPFAPAEVGHRTAAICHLLNIAMITGSPLKWDPTKEQITNNAEANRMLSRPMRPPWHL
ncbi:MAG TPA: Gfo/Idh/MocA family oxidoreductase [Phycisphaerae bacterium]|nr:Gfo/Idh/MocA family oxidoreductase [Phycisphaerae bacterium]